MQLSPILVQTLDANKVDISGGWLTSSVSVYTIDYAQVLAQPISVEAVTLSEMRWLAGVTNIIIRTGAGALDRVLWSGNVNLVAEPVIEIPATYLAIGSTITLTGDVAGSGPSTNIVTSISPATVTSKALTGYMAGSNTALSATDTILAAFGKVQGQINAKQNVLTNPITGTGTINYVPLFSNTTTLTNSRISDSGVGGLITLNGDTYIVGNAVINNSSIAPLQVSTGYVRFGYNGDATNFNPPTGAWGGFAQGVGGDIKFAGSQVWGLVGSVAFINATSSVTAFLANPVTMASSLTAAGNIQYGSNTAGSGGFVVNTASGSIGYYAIQIAGNTRWLISDSNAVVDDFAIRAYNSSGTFIDNAVLIANAATGAITLGTGRALVINSALYMTGSGVGTYNTGAIFCDTSAISIARPRVSDSAGAAIRSFTVSQRGGGTNYFEVADGTTYSRQNTEVSGILKVTNRARVDQSFSFGQSSAFYNAYPAAAYLRGNWQSAGNWGIGPDGTNTIRIGMCVNETDGTWLGTETILKVVGSGSFTNAVDAGNTRMQTWAGSSNYAWFGHSTQNNTTNGNSGFLQLSSGNVYMCAPTGGIVNLQAAGANRLIADASGVTISNLTLGGIVKANATTGLLTLATSADIVSSISSPAFNGGYNYDFLTSAPLSSAIIRIGDGSTTAAISFPKVATKSFQVDGNSFFLGTVNLTNVTGNAAVSGSMYVTQSYSTNKSNNSASGGVYLTNDIDAVNGYICGRLQLAYNNLSNGASGTLWNIDSYRDSLRIFAYSVSNPLAIAIEVTPSHTIMWKPTRIKGWADGSNSASGYVGEFITSSLSNTVTVAITSTSILDMTSIVLTAGDWDVEATIISRANIAATARFRAALGTDVTTITSDGMEAEASPPTGNAVYTTLTMKKRFNLTSGSYVYLSTQLICSSFGAASCWGHVSARRIR